VQQKMNKMLSISSKGEKSSLQRDIVLLETQILLSQLDSELFHHHFKGLVHVAVSVMLHAIGLC
jgi:hypothetical protein